MQHIRRLKNSRRGFTLVELVVVIAILSICSTMLVSVIATSMGRYTASSDMDMCKQQATQIDKQYARLASSAFEIKEETTYGTPGFTYQDNYYYMVLDPTEKTIEFLVGLPGNASASVILCKYVEKFEHKTILVENDSASSTGGAPVDNSGKKRYSQYVITMKNDFGEAVEYVYNGSIVLNNDTTDEFNDVYDLFDPAMTSSVCISFRMA